MKTKYTITVIIFYLQFIAKYTDTLTLNKYQFWNLNI
jgi:hypothetical protein